MKLIKPKYEIIEQDSGIQGIYKQIEIAGRTCYKSENNISENSAQLFTDKMIKSKHYAMLEHATVYLKYQYNIEDYVDENDCNNYYNAPFRDKYEHNQYSNVNIGSEDECFLETVLVTTNYRVLIENNWLDDLKYLCEPTEYHEKRVTVKFICDRITGESFLRHRVIPVDQYLLEELPDIGSLNDFDFSYARESTRYCNYSKNKFNNEISYIIPNWLNLIEGNSYDSELLERYDVRVTEGMSDESLDWITTLSYCEKQYMKMISKYNWKPEQARTILNFAICSPLVMTGTVSQWKEFFKLRDAKSAHPQAYELAHPLHIEFIRRGYLSE